MSNQFDITSNWIKSFGIQAVGALVAFFMQVVIARNVDVLVYGQFGIVINIINILTMIMLAGAGQVALRYSSIYFNNSAGKIKHLLRSGLLFISVNWLAVSVIVVSYMFFANHVRFRSLSTSVYILGIGLLLLHGYIIVFQSMARGQQQILKSIWPVSLLKPAIFVSLVFLVSMMSLEVNIETLIGFQFFIAVIIIGFYVNGSAEHFTGSNVFGHGRLAKRYLLSLKAGKNYSIINIIQTAIKNLDLILIGAFLSQEQAGLFNAASKINLVMIFALSSLNIAISPTIAKLFNQQKISELNIVMRKMNVKLGVVSALAFIGFVFLGEFVLGLFGPQYPHVMPVFLILIGANLLEAFFGPTGTILNMTGHQRVFSKIISLVLVLYILVMPLSLYYYGIIGAAWAVLFVTFFKNVMQWQFIHFRLHIETGLIGVVFAKMLRI